MKPVVRYPGTAVAPLRRMAAASPDAWKQVPKDAVSNPGEWYTARCDCNGSFDPRAPDPFSFTTGVWSEPDEIVIFDDPNYVRNCIEVDAEFPRIDSGAVGGWEVPDLLMLKLDYNTRSSRAPTVAPPYPFFGARHIADPFRPLANDGEDMTLLDAIEFSHKPLKVPTAYVIGDYNSANGSSMGSQSAVFRIYGVKPFNRLCIYSYGEFRGKGDTLASGFAGAGCFHAFSPRGSMPRYTLRTWYDGREDVLRVER